MRGALIVLGVLVGSSTAAMAQVPPTLGFNGVLLKDGAGFSHAGLAITFKLFDSETGGIAAWWEDHPSVPVDAGFYHVELGSTDAQKALDLRSQSMDERWLEVSAGELIGVLAPRIKLTATPFAWHAARADQAEAVSIVAGGSQFSVNAIFRRTTEEAAAVKNLGSFNDAGKTLGRFVFNGAVGYRAAKLACEAAVGSITAHMCTVPEMIVSYQMGVVDSIVDAAWVSSGSVHYYPMMTDGSFYYMRDCEGWTKDVHTNCMGEGFCNGPACTNATCIDKRCDAGYPVACCDTAQVTVQGLQAGAPSARVCP